MYVRVFVYIAHPFFISWFLIFVLIIALVSLNILLLNYTYYDWHSWFTIAPSCLYSRSILYYIHNSFDISDIYYLFESLWCVGVIIFGSDQEVAGVMRAVGRLNATGSFLWIGSDGWSARSLVSDGNEMQVEGTLSIQPKANPVIGFEKYFLGLTPKNNKRNPWFIEYWESIFNCKWLHSTVTPFNRNHSRYFRVLFTFQTHKSFTKLRSDFLVGYSIFTARISFRKFSNDQKLLVLPFFVW